MTGSSQINGRSWTFLTNHGLVLLCIARDPSIRLREIAERVGITERAAQRIVADLVADGYVERDRVGRRNQYRVDPKLPFRHPIAEHREIGVLIDAVVGPEAEIHEIRPGSGSRRRTRT